MFTNIEEEINRVESYQYGRLSELLNVLDPEEMLALMDLHFPWKRIGLGDLRAVYQFNEEYVLKAPIDKSGGEETRREQMIYREAEKLGLHLFLAENYYYEQDFVVQEYLRPFDSTESFVPYQEEAKRILSLLKETSADLSDTMYGENLRIDQWGLRGDQLVLLDYGFTE